MLPAICLVILSSLAWVTVQHQSLSLVTLYLALFHYCYVARNGRRTCWRPVADGREDILAVDRLAGALGRVRSGSGEKRPRRSTWAAGQCGQAGHHLNTAYFP